MIDGVIIAQIIFAQISPIMCNVWGEKEFHVANVELDKYLAVIEFTL